MANSIKPRIKPPALRAGDTVGIVAPASNIKPEMVEAGCDALRRLGYKPFYFDSILDQDLYFAGTVKRRANEIEAMFAKEEVRAILSARGGYGTNYLLPELDAAMFARAPIIFAGYSDVTSLLTWWTSSTGLVTFHAPMVAIDFSKADGVDLNSWKAAMEGTPSWEIASDAQPLVKGTAEGILYGGCLSMLVASLGTPYEIQTAGTVLFIEDVYAKPFQIDRMLMHLKLAGKLAGVRGLIFGEMLDCLQNAEQNYTLQEVILRVVGDLGIPIGFGLRSGHVSRGNITLPLGVQARLTVGSDVRLEILESATVPRK
jgi:muramoyltetrapeptide carboxypeptidase